MGNLDPDSLGLMASRILLVACMVAVLAAVEGTTTMNLSAKTSDSSFIRRLRGELEGVHDLGEEAEPESKKSEELAIPASAKVPKAIKDKQTEAQAAQKVAEERSEKSRLATAHAKKLAADAAEMTAKHVEKVKELNHKKVRMITEKAKQEVAAAKQSEKDSVRNAKNIEKKANKVTQKVAQQAAQDLAKDVAKDGKAVQAAEDASENSEKGAEKKEEQAVKANVEAQEELKRAQAKAMSKPTPENVKAATMQKKIAKATKKAEDNAKAKVTMAKAKVAAADQQKKALAVATAASAAGVTPAPAPASAVKNPVEATKEAKEVQAEEEVSKAIASGDAKATELAKEQLEKAT